MQNTKRLFVAVPLSPDLLQLTNDFIKDNSHLANIKWTEERNRHVTVCFLGDQNEKDIPEIINKIRALHKTLMPIVLTNPVFRLFPDEKSARMIWMQFEKRDCFKRLVTSFYRSLLNTAPDFDPNPHITMSRLKTPVFDLLGDNEMLDYYEEYNKLVLYESVLKPTGAEYIEMEEFLLQ